MNARRAVTAAAIAILATLTAACANDAPASTTAPLSAATSTVVDAGPPTVAAPIVSPDPVKTYLRDLDAVGVPYSTPHTAVNVGRRICDEYGVMGTSSVIIVALERNYPNLTEVQRLGLFNAALTNFCPADQ